MIRLFEEAGHAKIYSKFRPTYPDTVIKSILNYFHEKSSFNDMALDIGCGSGQSTLALAPHFKNVLGIDVSEEQISQTPKDIPHVSFKAGPAEELTYCQSGSVDLITTAQALHWMDRPKLYGEVKRVLKPDAVFAVYGYGNVDVDDKKASNLISKEFYEDTLKDGGYWDKQRNHIDNLYREFELPFQDFNRLDHLKMEKQWTVGQLEGYITTWSGYRAYLKKNPESTILTELMQKVKDIYASKEGKGEEITVSWPIFILLGRK